MGKTTYDIIKHQNGEAFARALRDATLLEMPGIAQLVKFAGRDATPELIDYIYALKQFDDTNERSDQDPFELLHRAGYEFVEYANTREKQNAIKKYFRRYEELCTFNDETRYQEYYIVNAVKYNADEIKPRPIPQRQDEYGTSVISIQMRKTGGFISIKNRYNHSVEYCDSTYDNNPDNIIDGLSAALKTRFNVNWSATKVALPRGYARIGDHILKYNYEINNTYIGENFYEQHGRIHELDKSRQTMIDYFIWDAAQQKLLNPTGIMDGFIQAFETETRGKKVTITGRAPNQSILADGEAIIKLRGSQIVELHFPTVERTGFNFLSHNTVLHRLSMPALKKAGLNFLTSNKLLSSLNLPNLEHTGDGFVAQNESIQSVYLPKLKTVAANFMSANCDLTEISLPSLVSTGPLFLANNQDISSVNFPRLAHAGPAFMMHNFALTEVSLPSLVTADNDFLRYNTTIAHFSADRLQTVGDNFLGSNQDLMDLSLPELTEAGEGFIYMYSNLETLSVPKLKKAGPYFLQKSIFLKTLNAPLLEEIRKDSLMSLPVIRQQILSQRPNPFKRAVRKIKRTVQKKPLNRIIRSEKTKE